MLYLDQSVLQSLELTSQSVVECMERMIIGQVEGVAWSNPKSVIQPGDGRYMMSTLSAVDDPPYLAAKSIVLNPENPRDGLPQINGLIVLLDSRSGVPLAILDGNWITAIRTAGASALVARRLARAESHTITFIGAGLQARSHLRLFAELFPLEQIFIYGRGKPNRLELSKVAESLRLEVKDCEQPKKAILDADMVISSLTLTDMIDPFIDPNWLKTGVFLSSTDCAKPFRQSDMSIFDCVIIDDMKQEAAMMNPMLPKNLISGDLFSLLSGRTEGRKSERERCAFVFRSVAIGDLALSTLAYETACRLGVGLQFD
ncbi:MAG: ornithine cyclodeaminase family protein [Gammaproteobacteria bacterium]|nr:ornithine cyclodeaminase family protein [Gammaproteobacteria bacterium]